RRGGARARQPRRRDRASRPGRRRRQFRGGERDRGERPYIGKGVRGGGTRRPHGFRWLPRSGTAKFFSSSHTHRHIRMAEQVETVAGAATADAVPVQRGAETGWFGAFGGRYVPETLITALDELAAAYAAAQADPSF